MNYYEIFEGNDLRCKGTADECAKALCMSRNAFYSFVFRNKDAKSAKYSILEKKSKKAKLRKTTEYTVYLKKTDEIIVAGDAATCADGLNMSMHSFYSLVSRVRSGKNQKYEIEMIPRDSECND